MCPPKRSLCLLARRNTVRVKVGWLRTTTVAHSPNSTSESFDVIIARSPLPWVSWVIIRTCKPADPALPHQYWETKTFDTGWFQGLEFPGRRISIVYQTIMTLLWTTYELRLASKHVSCPNTDSTCLKTSHFHDFCSCNGRPCHGELYVDRFRWHRTTGLQLIQGGVSWRTA